MHLDYSLVLFCLLAVTGAVWLADVAVLRRARRGRVAATFDPDDWQPAPARDASPSTARHAAGDDRRRLHERAVRAPGWIELAVGFFPVLLAVFLLRAFVIEPFRIPSESMLPTLDVGDFIVVNKFAYGLRLPIVDREVVPIGAPQRGDVVVFRYPGDLSEDYVKRVIGLPGDTIVYRDKRLVIDGRPVPMTGASLAFAGALERARESLPRGAGVLVHDVLLDAHRAGGNEPMVRFPFFDRCRYAAGPDPLVTCTVPPGNYFVMGDNRDNSADSRYWGFVPDRNLVGRAMLVWMNFTHPGRIGTLL